MNFFSTHNTRTARRTKVAIVGAGAVGSTIAYTATLKNVASEIILIDKDIAKEEGNVMDIDDGLCFVETGCIKGADMHAARDADIIVITAGAPQKPGETRLDLVEKNTKVLTSIFRSIGKLHPHTIVIIVSNPVDILTRVAQRLSKLPASQVFGTGTALDTARLKTQLSQVFRINTKHIHGYVLGEHGDSGFVAWSTVSVGGVPMKQLPQYTPTVAKQIEESVRHEAYEIIHRKGATYFGIAQTVTRMIQSILFDQHSIMPVSLNVEKQYGISNVCISIPAVIGRNGIERIWPVHLQASEIKKLQQSANTLSQYL